MEKRAHERIPVSVDMRFYCWSTLYPGKILNLSESGMFINTKESCYPSDSQLEIYIPHKEDVLYIPSYLCRIVWVMILPDDSSDSIGVEIVNPPRSYLDFVRSFKIQHI